MLKQLEALPQSVTGRSIKWSVRDVGILAAFAVIFLSLSALSPVFLTSGNLQNLLSQTSEVGIVAVVATIVIIAGGFDLSVGSIYAISGVVSAQLVSDIGVPAALAAGVLTGGVLGAINGAIVAYGKVNSFIATLATGIIIAGLARMLTDDKLIIVDKTDFSTFGNGSLFGIEYAVWLFGLVSALCWILLSYTTFGRAVYAVGGNEEAARLSGVRVDRIRLIAFMLSGLSAGLAGIIVASRVSTGQADVGGVDFAFSVISAVVVGGTSLLGGAGAVWRTLVGVFLLAMIGNGLNLLSVDNKAQQIVTGVIIIIAVALDYWVRRRAGK